MTTTTIGPLHELKIMFRHFRLSNQVSLNFTAQKKVIKEEDVYVRQSFLFRPISNFLSEWTLFLAVCEKGARQKT